MHGASLSRRQRDHAGGGCALGAGQPAEAGQEGPHLLHRRAAAGSGAGPGGPEGPRLPGLTLTPSLLSPPPGHAGTVCSGQQPRRTNTSEAGGHDGAESESHSGEGQPGRAGRRRHRAEEGAEEVHPKAGGRQGSRPCIPSPPHINPGCLPHPAASCCLTGVLASPGPVVTPAPSFFLCLAWVFPICFSFL